MIFLLKSITLIACTVVCISAQLSFHTDAHRNSFTLQTPSLQQTFTRYYGGSAAAPIQSLNNGQNNLAGALNAPLTASYTQQQILQQQQQQQQQHQFQQEQQQVFCLSFSFALCKKLA